MFRRTIYKIYSGDCPRFNRYQEIEVEYQEVPRAGHQKSGYKRVSYECPHSNDCPHMDEYGRCPVCLSTPVVI